MVVAVYALLHDAHVRVDIFYRPSSLRYKAVVDLFGSLLLLLPLVVIVVMSSYGYVIDSWQRLEVSRETGGLPGLFLLKSVITVFCLLIGLQGLSLAARRFPVLLGHLALRPEEEETGPFKPLKPVVVG